MPRKKISEFRAKTILATAFGQKYDGVEVDLRQPTTKTVDELATGQTYTVKVDQAEKGRFKKGLVKLNRKSFEVTADLAELSKLGFDYALIEPYIFHDASAERYLAAELVRGGLRISSAAAGGVDIESNSAGVEQFVYDAKQVVNKTQVPEPILQKLVAVCETNNFSFLEINPLLIRDGAPVILDAAVEVDDEAEFFSAGWTGADIRRSRARQLSVQEKSALELNDKSQASFMLESLNANGAVFLLLSGGGASVTVADEVSNLGYGAELGNYGEYSGNSNEQETELYTKQLLELLLASNAPHKILIIAGATANFTDVHATFKGVIGAISAHQKQLADQAVAVYVRRGGPHEKEGLNMMSSYLDQAGLRHEVYGPELPLTDIAAKAVSVLTGKV